MIQIHEALRLIDSSIEMIGIELLPVQFCTDRILAEEVIANIDLPPFRQSAMDGYAIHFDPDTDIYTIDGEIPAGSDNTFELKPGHCVRIFTGARVPDSCNAVIMQEYCEVKENLIHIRSAVKTCMHIRNRGEQIKHGDLVIPRGVRITPSAIGLVCSLGITKLTVFKRPSIAIIATGNELISPGQELSGGKIYESNSFMLASAIEHYKLGIPQIFHAADNPEEISALVKKCTKRADFILLSGGISAGKYDHVKEALEKNNVTAVFHQIRQKPGKPLFMGISENNKYFFALPGNPAAALTSFLMYVLPAIRKASGEGFTGLKKLVIPLLTAYHKSDNKVHLLKALVNSTGAQLLNGQNSDVLTSFVKANAIAYIPEDKQFVRANELVDIYLF